ncbi:Zinc finger BED domain-containing protein 4 [Eumeta japonica]|uniref:Zinc finger BED domain-containing protein 4 n=1 Tax=Eumeta variegata TaxID=151549 RepID=A0A4C1VBV9_EUMVA|nr:Zinc finger BED domain-containing protein 4 [Eumeta japonica]
MIAIDNEPLSIVDHHEGFKRLLNNALPQYTIPGRTYFTKTIIPDMYERVVRKLKNELEMAEAIAFTSDLWTSSVNNAAFLSFTGHWISENFKLNHGVLNMAHFPESHTSKNIKIELLQCVTKWDIAVTKIQAIVYDNGANMVKGVKETLFPSERCFIHTLQLAINNALNPRYKDFFFDATQAERIRRAVLREGLRLSLDEENEDSDPETPSKRSRLYNEADAHTRNTSDHCESESGRRYRHAARAPPTHGRHHRALRQWVIRYHRYVNIWWEFMPQQ